MKVKLSNNKTLIGILFLGFLAVTLPITILLIRDTTNLASRAALPDMLETEAGVLSSSGVSKQTDSGASGGSYVLFNKTNSPTPTTPPNTSNRGPRPAPAVPTGNNVYTIPSSIPNNGTGDTGLAIENWLKSLPSGSIAVFTSNNTEGYRHGDTPYATYRFVTNGINVPPGITLWGYGVKIKFETPGTQFSHAAFSLYPQGNLDIRGFEIEGLNQNAGTKTAHPVGRQHGIAIAIAGNTGSDISAQVTDSWVHKTYSDAFFVAGWGDTDTSPSGFEIAYNLFEMTGRYGIVVNQNDSGSVWIHHNIIKDTALNLIGGEDQRLGTEKMVNALIEYNDLGTFMWHDTDGWLPHGIGWNYDWWDSLPNIAEVGPITIRNNTWIGGCADPMFQRHGSATNYISQETKASASDYHNITITENDWSGIPANQRSIATWAAVHNTRNVTLTNNTGLGAMAERYEVNGSTGITINNNN